VPPSHQILAIQVIQVVVNIHAVWCVGCAAHLREERDSVFRLFLRRRRRRRHDAKRLVDSRTQPFTVRRRSDDRSSPLAYVSIYVRPHRLLPAGGRRGLLRS